MKYRLKTYSILEYGQRKDASGLPHQEDCIYPAPGYLSASDRTFILCDGMGGHDAGEVASATVCDALGHALSGGSREFTPDDFNSALKGAFDALDGKDTHAEKKMGTTLAFLRLYDEGAFIAHIGDSRVYHIRPGKTGDDTEILHETSDHSLVNELIKAGELTREEARNSRQKNVITRAMQPHLDSRPKADVHTTSDIRPGDYFYLCSDGMLEQPDMENGVSLKNIFSEEGGSPAEKVKILRKVTERNKDNHSAFIVYIEDVLDKDHSTGSLDIRDEGKSEGAPEGHAKDKSAEAAESHAKDKSAKAAEITDKVHDRNKSVIIFCIAVLIAAIIALLWKLL